MTPREEQEARMALEYEAAALSLAAILMIDASLLSGNLYDVPPQTLSDAGLKMERARDIGWRFVRDNAADESIGNDVYSSNDNFFYGVSAAGWILDGSRKIVLRSTEGLDGKEKYHAAKNVLKDRRGARAESYAVDTIHPAVEAGKALVISQLAGGNATKTWDTVGDDRVRFTHEQADGQTVPVNGFFLVGGYSMRYPRDFNAPANETRGCRCSANYSVSWSK